MKNIGLILTTLALGLTFISLVGCTSTIPDETKAPTKTMLSKMPVTPSSTTAEIDQPSSTISPISTPAPILRPPELITFLQSGMSISDINPQDFADATGEVNRVCIQLFGETYYEIHQDLIDYYKPHDINKLEITLLSLANLTDWQYEADYFDCSEMTALTEYALEAAGFETLMVSSLDPTGTGDPTITTGHAWCVVVMKTSSGTQLIPIEATAPGHPQIPQKGKRTAYKAKGKTGYQSYDDYITRGWILDTIYEAYYYLPDEFDWWNSAEINRNWFKSPPQTLLSK